MVNHVILKLTNLVNHVMIKITELVNYVMLKPTELFNLHLFPGKQDDRTKEGNSLNESFFALPEEKRNKIINGALHVFAKYDFKKATTDEIVRCAGISKGLLFYYFGNKKGLYLYLLEYSYEYVLGRMALLRDSQETDLFRILKDVQECKLRILAEHPDIMMFVIQTYYEKSPQVRSETGRSYDEVFERSIEQVLTKIDQRKFREEIAPRQAVHIVLWMAEGFMQRFQGRTLEIQELTAANQEYLEHVDVLRRCFYRPEYLEEENGEKADSKADSEGEIGEMSIAKAGMKERSDKNGNGN